MRLLWPCLAMVIGSGTEAGELAHRVAPAAATMPATPLRTLSSTTAPIGDYFAWAGQALCDDNGNSYFLVVQPIAGHKLKEPRAVLRISADGTKRLSFNPAAAPEFASAHELLTLGFALDPEGGVFLLIHHEMGGQSGQYIVSFDKNGEYRFYFEVDSREIVVQQFEVFGSGQFLLRGRRPDGAPRLAILSGKGGELKEVIGWSRLHRPFGDPGNGSIVRLSQVARGGDGRIYLAEPDARQGGDVVYAFRPSGDWEEALTLRPMPKAPELLDWKAAGDRFAATYFGADPQPEASSNGRMGSYWIAVYGNVGAGDDGPPVVYGPVPRTPICYWHEDSGDRFTFLQEGKLVTMAPALATMASR